MQNCESKLESQPQNVLNKGVNLGGAITQQGASTNESKIINSTTGF